MPALASHHRDETKMDLALPLKEAFRARRIPAIAAGDHPRCAGRARCVCADADRRRQIALFSVAGADARGADHRRFAAHFADERSGRCAANQRDRGDVLEFDAGSGGREGALARVASRRVPDALCRAGAIDAGDVFGTRAQLEHRADRHRRSALHQRMGPRFPAGIS